MQGIVTRIESKDYYVLHNDKEIRCTLRGKLRLEAEWKKDKLLYTDLVVVGDYVEFSLNEDSTGVIEELPKRVNYISRKAPRIKGMSEKGKRFEQIIAANIDYTFCVTSIAQPPFNNRVLDRMLVTAESCGTKPIIIINKIDLQKKRKKIIPPHLSRLPHWLEFGGQVNSDALGMWYELYSELGYEVIKCSAVSKEGVDKIKELVQGKVSVFIGHSGVGKSSIINLLGENISLPVGEISEAWDKGVHTTVTSVMLRLDDNSFVIDTPGLREIEPYGITAGDITHYFKEIAGFAVGCKFSTCTHTHEPNCKVKDAVEEGGISEKRYDSYLRLIESLDEEEF